MEIFYNKICEYELCKQKFITKSIRQKYCCSKCTHAGNKRKRTGFLSTMGTTLICKGCNIPFIKHKKGQIYCTITCSKIHISKEYYINNKEKWSTIEVRTRQILRHPYRKYKKGECELCGFIPVNQCQLDIDHKDGNHNNNETSNLQTLCANCHRLKTFLNKEGVYRPNKK